MAAKEKYLEVAEKETRQNSPESPWLASETSANADLWAAIGSTDYL